MNEILPTVETALTAAWGGSVRLALREHLESRQHIARLDVLASPPGMPKTVILKRWRREGDAGFDPNSFDIDLLNDWTSLEFIARIFGKETLAPQFYVGDQEKGYFVIEDLLEGDTLDRILRGNNAIQAEQAFKSYGETLGRLHAQTLGQSEAFVALQRKFDHRGVPEPDGHLGLLQTSLKRLETLGFRVQSTAYSEVQRAAKQLAQLEVFSALHHGDPIPSNAWIAKRGGLYLFDFESAHFDHAFLEAVGPRMGFPTCGLAFVNRVPEAIWRQAETAYQAILVTYCPEAADKTVYGSATTAACALLALAFCENWLARALVGDLPSIKLNRVRQCAIARLEAFVHTTREFNSSPALGETFTALLIQLRSRWPSEAHNLPVYPALQEGNS